MLHPQRIWTHRKDTFTLIHGQRYARRSIFPFAVNSEAELREPTRTGVLLARINQ